MSRPGSGDTRTDEALASFHRLGPDAILDAVESTGRRCSGHLLALASYENRVYQVGLDDAPSLVAKFYRPGRWSDAAIEEEHAFTAELASVEIPAVAPLADAAGRTLHHHGRYRFSLYPSVGGRAPSLDDPGTLKQLGRLIGRVHAVGAAGRFRHRPALAGERPGRAEVEYLLGEDVLPPELHTPYRHVAEAVLQRVDEAFAATGRLRTLRLHGDCHVGNVLMDGEVARLVDFDDTCTGPAVQDLWLLLSGDRDYMEARLAEVLEGYTAFADFDPRELALIESLRALRMLRYAAWLTRRRSDPAFVQAFPWFYEATFWDRHVQMLQEQLAALGEPRIEWR